MNTDAFLSQRVLKQQLEDHELRPKKRLGQHFLVERAILEAIHHELSLEQRAAKVVEIGAGMGSLTRYLATLYQQVLAIEYDRDMIPILRENLQNYPTVTVQEGDALQVDLMSWVSGDSVDGDYDVVANLPYQITSPMLERLFTFPKRPKEMLLMIQADVADRILARDRVWSSLAVTTQLLAEVQHIRNVPPGCFYPVPKVDSAVIRLSTRQQVTSIGAIPDLQAFVRRNFGQRRKQLARVLAVNERLPLEAVEKMLAQAGLTPRVRPQEVPPAKWQTLYTLIHQKGTRCST